MSKELEEFMDDVFKKFNCNITDRIFKMIQNDKKLMQDYLKLVGDKGKETVNQQLGKKIKNVYKLKNKVDNGEEMEEEAESTIIKTYSVHE